MKRFLLLLIIIVLQTACKSRKVAVDTISNKSETNTEQVASVSRSAEARIITDAQRTVISDTTNETKSKEGLEFEADSVSYNANTGELKFKPKGKVKFNRLNQSKSNGQRKITDTTHRQIDLKSGSDSTGKIKAAASSNNSGKHKTVDAKSDTGNVLAILLLVAGVALFIYKKIS
jgi:hypothetical protein